MFDDSDSNPGHNPSFENLHNADLPRRSFVKAGLGALAVSFFHSPDSATAAESCLPFSFTSVPVSKEDTVCVPEGYVAQVLYPWGHPLHGNGPAFKPDASNTAAEQMLQAGMGHDGMQWFSHPEAAQSSSQGLLALNHEYTDQGLLFTDGIATMSAEKVQKSQAAHGISIIAVERGANQEWKVVDSQWNRRITANTPMQLTGPAAGSTQVKTTADPSGTKVLGTFNNCASGITPWGTYLTCEENFNSVFGTTAAAFELSTHQIRYGLSLVGYNNVYQWWKHDHRFDLAKEPNEANRFGYVVEIDPTDKTSTPRKHTALGRIKHENAAVTLTADNRVVVYMGDDEKNEYIYKFVSAGKYDPQNRTANLELLTTGTLYVARFDLGGRGVWLALEHGKNGLTVENGFADQADICVRTRQAADRAGATMMDRPEWVAVHPTNKQVYVTLSNNSNRGKAPASVHSPSGTAEAGKAQPPIDAANPRASNVFGQILRWKEVGNDSAAEAFVWEHFLLAGDPNVNDQVSINGDSFGSPDGLTFDRRGILWIQTDVSTSTLNRGPYEKLGNNMMLAADPQTRTVRRFLTGPCGCEITGLTFTPDFSTMFVNIQHPGEPDSDVSDPLQPKAVSSWPDGPNGGRPRPATVAIWRKDGKPVGA